MSEAPPEPDPWADAMLATRLFASDPHGFGGIWLRGDGPARDALLATLLEALDGTMPVRRIPVSVDGERLLGGLDLAATLAGGKPVRRAGLLEEAAGGIALVPMAERLDDGVAAPLRQAMDGDRPVALILLDDGLEADEAPPAALVERCAFRCDVRDVRPEGAGGLPLDPSTTLRTGFARDERGEGGPYLDFARYERSGGGEGAIETVPLSAVPITPPFVSSGGPSEVEARSRDTASGTPELSTEQLSAIAVTAAALGIESVRPLLFATRAASSIAADREGAVDEETIARAMRLVFAHRATRLPAEAPPDAEPEPPPPSDAPDRETDTDQPSTDLPLEDMLLAAALAAIPPDILESLAMGKRSARRGAMGRAGAKRNAKRRGRPRPARPGKPPDDGPLALIDTLRAAAPWQAARRAGAAPGGRLAIRMDDLRVRRFEQKRESLTIFAVDVSGSAALARLAEAKGAVELMLARAYVRRAQVALIAFRGQGAELLLPPTRSLTRARRTLSELPGGGGTPLAAGLELARSLAEASLARGQTPMLALLTDGKANVPLGEGGRAEAMADAEAMAKRFAALGVDSVTIDIAPRPRPEAEALAANLGGRYCPMPNARADQLVAALDAPTERAA